MTTQQEIICRAKQLSIAKGLAVQLTGQDGTTSRQYFQHRDSYEDFINRALYQGCLVTAVTQLDTME